MKIILSKVKLWQIFSLVLLTLGSLQAQDYKEFKQQVRLPSADAMAAIKSIQNPPGLFTGATTINIPICAIPGAAVSLSYHTGGIKVQEYASSVGLGWTLNAGGMITRIVRGLPDELSNGYYDQTNRGAAANPYNNAQSGRGTQVENFVNEQSSGSTSAGLGNFGNGVYDSEPDLYYFKVGGMSGKFTFDAQGEAVLLPYQNLKITRLQGQYFRITTPNGTRYDFGIGNAQGSSANYRYTVNKGTWQHVVNGVTQSTSPEYITTWHLAKISSPVGSRVDFFYKHFTKVVINDDTITSQEDFEEYIHYYESLYNQQTPNSTTELQVDHRTIYDILKIEKQLYLSEIRTSQGSINFIWSAQYNEFRKDLYRSPSLKSIIKGPYTNLAALGTSLDQSLSSFQRFHKVYDFTYGYLGKADTQRLILKSVGVKGLTPHVFDYNTLALPNRSSRQIDHWGHYNKNTYTRNGKISAIPGYTFGSSNLTFGGANRTVDIVRQQAGMLTKITFPNAGFTAYEYESNTFAHQGSTIKGGGLRLKKVTTYDGYNSQKNQIVHYKYNQVDAGDTYAPLATTSGLHHGTYPYPYRFTFTLSGSNKVNNTLFSNTPLFWNDGLQAKIGYQTVTTYQEGNGYVVNDFTSYADAPDTFEGTTILPQTPATSVFWKRGLPKTVRVFRQNNSIQKHTAYTYISGGEKKRIPGLRTFKLLNYSGLDVFQYGYYYLISEAYRLDKMVDKSYTDDVPAKFIETSTAYAYGAHHELPTTVTTTLADGQIRLAKNIYTMDYDFSSAGNALSKAAQGIKKMQEANMLRVIESTVWLQENQQAPQRLLGGSISEFDDTFRPLKRYVLDVQKPLATADYTPSTHSGANPYQKDLRYREIVAYESDEYGLTVRKTDGIPTTTMFGRGYTQEGGYHTVRYAQVVNATSSQLAYTSFENIRIAENSSIRHTPIDNKWALHAANTAAGATVKTDAYTGKYSFRGKMVLTGLKSATTPVAQAGQGGTSCSGVFLAPSLDFVNHHVRLDKGAYVLSFWAKGNFDNSYPTANNKIVVNQCQTIASSEFNGQWKRFEYRFTLPDNPFLSIETFGDVLIDEVRLHPPDARMVTYVTNPMLGVISTANAQGIPSFNEYDIHGRLTIQRDVDGYIVRKNEYNEPHTEQNAGNPGQGNGIINVLGNTACFQTGDNISFKVDSLTGYMVCDFGDGSDKIAAPVGMITHAYNKPGTYEAKIVVTNKASIPQTLTKTVTIKKALRLRYVGCGTMDLFTQVINDHDHPCTFDACNENNGTGETSINVRAIASGGTNSLVYTWYWKTSGSSSSWVQLSASGQSIKLPYATSNYQIKCVVTDGCHSREKTTSVLVTKSNPNCGNE